MNEQIKNILIDLVERNLIKGINKNITPKELLKIELNILKKMIKQKILIFS